MRLHWRHLSNAVVNRRQHVIDHGKHQFRPVHETRLFDVREIVVLDEHVNVVILWRSMLQNFGLLNLLGRLGHMQLRLRRGSLWLLWRLLLSLLLPWLWLDLKVKRFALTFLVHCCMPDGVVEVLSLQLLEGIFCIDHELG